MSSYKMKKKKKKKKEEEEDCERMIMKMVSE